jgi:uncharacterized membrane protein
MRSLLVLTLLAFGCTDSSDDSAPADDTSGTDDSAPPKVECDDSITWDSWGQKFFATYCTDCHSSELTGAARHGAPDVANFDTYEGVAARWNYVIEMATGFNPRMPPTNPEPTDEERDILYAWLWCEFAPD